MASFTKLALVGKLSLKRSEFSTFGLSEIFAVKKHIKVAFDFIQSCFERCNGVSLNKPNLITGEPSESDCNKGEKYGAGLPLFNTARPFVRIFRAATAIFVNNVIHHNSSGNSYKNDGIGRARQIGALSCYCGVCHG